MCGQVNNLEPQFETPYSENYIDGGAGVVSTENNFKNDSDIEALITPELRLDCDKEKSSNNCFQLGSPIDDDIFKKKQNRKRQVDWHWVNACIGMNFYFFFSI